MPKISVERHAVSQPQDPSYRLIPLTQGQNAIVDSEDFEWLSKWNWFANWLPEATTFYAQRSSYGRKLYMHREIIHASNGVQCDHINFNGLDNRKINLRKCTNAENKWHTRPHKNNKCGYKGVRQQGRMWTAAIRIHSHLIRLGSFNSAKEAAYAFDKAAKKYHGEFAYLNFPQ